MAFKKSIINGKNSHRQPPPQQQQQQLNLFPLHPENLVEDKDTQYDNVCLLFNSTEEDNVHAGPLYIEGGDQSPQTVPNLHDAAAATVVGDAWGNASIDLWRVPEMISNDVGGVQIKEEVDVAEDWKRGHREASVLRYKEKRQNRLFSKRIRYEVRKLNAEKRPRLKGRFVKRD
ncbi:hypothetical protein COLO4_29226 [Corchorus olitorius]|uniref:CCT domain-containing protein n=1 Tax=Corchorus olitorius TaxID=93759 RepID=A0A1R3HFQ1_9ROSI|nr:hypothetical protein COLO4_29226 [Corchorus olitorius]